MSSCFLYAPDANNTRISWWNFCRCVRVWIDQILACQRFMMERPLKIGENFDHLCVFFWFFFIEKIRKDARHMAFYQRTYSCVARAPHELFQFLLMFGNQLQKYLGFSLKKRKKKKRYLSTPAENFDFIYMAEEVSRYADIIAMYQYRPYIGKNIGCCAQQHQTNVASRTHRSSKWNMHYLFAKLTN